MKNIILSTLLLINLTGWVQAHDTDIPASLEHYSFEKLTKNIHVVHGTQALPSLKTRGFMNNPAIITTKKGIIVIDPGSSKEIGKQLLEKIKTISDKPVIAVFNTHVHGDHWLGNHGIRTVYPQVPIYAHQRMIDRVKDGDGQQWINLLMGMTKNVIKDTQVVVPNIGLKGGETLKLGGTTLKIHHTGKAHSDSDIMIEVVEDKGLFFGDIVAAKRVPNSDVPQDASFKGTINAIDVMLKGPSTLFIPGHGLSGGREVPEMSLRFLVKLQESVTRYYNQGLSDFEMKEKVIKDLSEFKDWHNFNEMGRVIAYVFQEVENDSF
ncbi:MAG: MBL fold metallo-hydrolase [Gammaproteobacteria bacterium]|nr:MBL fold metallo-hydrolase [Gammaproteobacteria bacterium]